MFPNDFFVFLNVYMSPPNRMFTKVSTYSTSKSNTTKQYTIIRFVFFFLQERITGHQMQIDTFTTPTESIFFFFKSPTVKCASTHKIKQYTLIDPVLHLLSGSLVAKQDCRGGDQKCNVHQLITRINQCIGKTVV